VLTQSCHQHSSQSSSQSYSPQFMS
jgi:hypothetical protein